MISMNDLLILMVQKKASDLHLTVGAPPAGFETLRLHRIIATAQPENVASCRVMAGSLIQ